VKTAIQLFPQTSVSSRNNFEDGTDRPLTEYGPAEWVEQSPERFSSTTHAGISPVQWVGVLAFVHSLVFLAIWLLICASAGAGTTPQGSFDGDLQKSVYKPVKQRDPFNLAGVTASDSKVLPTATIALHLEGILYQPGNPAAIVNGTLVTLNKTASINAGNGEIQVRAIEITRNRVVLQAGDQKVELLLNSQNPTPNKQ